MGEELGNHKPRRKLWLFFPIAGLLMVGAFALVSKEIAAVLFWPLWVSCLFSALSNLLPEIEGVVLVRREMSPTDLPQDARIPLTLMTETEKKAARHK